MNESMSKPKRLDIIENNKFISDLLSAKSFTYCDYNSYAEMLKMKYHIMDLVYDDKIDEVNSLYGNYIIYRKNRSY